MLAHKPVYVTQQGLARLEEELTYIRTVKRAELIEALQDAKGNGDWIDNTEYLLLENELAFVDGRILMLEQMIKHAELIGPCNADNVVDIGETVVIQTNEDNLERYTIVGVPETDPGQGLISNESPLGQALIGHEVGDEVVFRAPDGEHHCRIVAVT